jgi:hypothetical protein
VLLEGLGLGPARLGQAVASVPRQQRLGVRLVERVARLGLGLAGLVPGLGLGLEEQVPGLGVGLVERVGLVVQLGHRLRQRPHLAEEEHLERQEDLVPLRPQLRELLVEHPRVGL